MHSQAGKDCVEDSAPEQTGFCLDFHLGTRARNSVSSGRKRRLPPQGTDKDLINTSESHPSWPGARALRWRTSRGWEGIESGSRFPIVTHQTALGCCVL